MGGLPILKASGLQTAHNPFSGVTPGAMLIAKNVVVFANGVIQPRRGHRNYSEYTSTTSKSGSFYGSALVFQNSTSDVSYDSGSAFTSLGSTYTPSDDDLLRMKFVESKNNLYFNTATGLKVAVNTIESESPRSAGLPAPRIRGVTTTASGTFIEPDNQIGFRFTYAYVDDHGNLFESAPSPRYVVINLAAGATDGIQISTWDPAADAPLPDDIDTAPKLRVYATAPSGSDDIDPGDEMYMVAQYEAPIEGGPNYYVTFSDLSERSLVTGYPLYTNTRGGESILQANTRPPIAKDICTFAGRMWFANTTSKHRLFIDMLGTGSPGGVQNGDTITIAGVVHTAGTDFTVTTAGTAATNIETTSRALMNAINDPTRGSTVSAYYLSTSASSPGSLLLEANALGTDAFTVSTSRSSSWNYNGSTSDNDRMPHGLFYSKLDQPEAVPLLNYLRVGSQSKEILRIVPLREKLYVFKEDGIFTVTGEAPFTVDCLDATTRLVSPDTAQVLNNQILAFTNQGVVAVSDAGIQLLSRAIEDQLLPYLNENMRALVKRHAFAVAHETDRTYELWVPSAPADSTACTTAFVWNTLTTSWTTWEVADGYKWGTVSPTDVRYYGGPEGVYYERRDFASTDLADHSDTVSLGDWTVDGDGNATSLVIGDLDVQVGDVVTCTSSVGSVSHSAIVATVGSASPSESEVTLHESIIAAAFQAGACTVEVSRAFECEVQWSAVAFDRPGSLKRFQYGTLHFGLPSTFTTAYATYETETSGFLSTESVTITGRGWGTGAWGTSYFGDTTKNLSLRHTIPLEQQRAAMAYPGFKIREAFSQWKLHGLTLDTEETSERTSR